MTAPAPNNHKLAGGEHVVLSSTQVGADVQAEATETDATGVLVGEVVGITTDDERRTEDRRTIGAHVAATVAVARATVTEHPVAAALAVTFPPLLLWRHRQEVQRWQRAHPGAVPEFLGAVRRTANDIAKDGAQTVRGAFYKATEKFRALDMPDLARRAANSPDVRLLVKAASASKGASPAAAGALRALESALAHYDQQQARGEKVQRPVFADIIARELELLATREGGRNSETLAALVQLLRYAAENPDSNAQRI